MQGTSRCVVTHSLADRGGRLLDGVDKLSSFLLDSLGLVHAPAASVDDHLDVALQLLTQLRRRFVQRHAPASRNVRRYLSRQSILVQSSKMVTVTKGFDARLANRPFSVFDFRVLWRSTLRFSCLSRTPTCGRQTDGRTDTRRRQVPH